MKGSHKEGPITLIDSHVTQVAGTDAAPINTVELGPEGHIALRTEPPARVLGFQYWFIKITASLLSALHQPLARRMRKHGMPSWQESPLLSIRVEFTDGTLIGPLGDALAMYARVFVFRNFLHKQFAIVTACSAEVLPDLSARPSI